MKPTVYEYKHSKLKPNTAFGFAQKFSPKLIDKHAKFNQ